MAVAFFQRIKVVLFTITLVFTNSMEKDKTLAVAH